MRFCQWSHTVLVAVCMGSPVAGTAFSTTAMAADVATDQSVSVAMDLPSAATVTIGPVYAFGPVLETKKPRAPKYTWNQPNWSGRSAKRSNGWPPAPQYPNYQTFDDRHRWQAYPPRGNWNAQASLAYRYGYPNPWTQNHASRTRAWFDPHSRRTVDPTRHRQPYWHY